MANVIKYLNLLRNGRVGPSGQVTKLTTLQNALSLLVARMSEDGCCSVQNDLVVRVKVVETKIRGLQKSLRCRNKNEEEGLLHRQQARQRYCPTIPGKPATVQAHRKLCGQGENDGVRTAIDEAVPLQERSEAGANLQLAAGRAACHIQQDPERR